ncbi:hypothetical protein [Chryseobacterium nepalense]|uniref:Uncharacterized protein n=1 Tax=Chryseobacterium nepalense TaxID=1854498 RepID=A0ABY4K9V6_9FLAO|nr:hypothetical protein [Chryseobacterium nepalense]UPQ77339.1 hypothetical protein M0D58_07240 [Chryseobacterium nepalense]
MKEVFVKKYWEEEDVLFYLHFQDNKAVRQLEITPTSKLKLTLNSPINGESILYDQTLDELDLQESDFITEEDFNKIWNEYIQYLIILNY